MNESIKEKIIINGVRNLKDFGYYAATKENIMTDEVYKMFFKNMLENSLGYGFDKEVDSILKDMESKIIRCDNCGKEGSLDLDFVPQGMQNGKQVYLCGRCMDSIYS